MKKDPERLIQALHIGPKGSSRYYSLYMYTARAGKRLRIVEVWAPAQLWSCGPPFILSTTLRRLLCDKHRSEPSDKYLYSHFVTQTTRCRS